MLTPTAFHENNFLNLLLCFLAFSRSLPPKVLGYQPPSVLQWIGSINLDHHCNCVSSLTLYFRTTVPEGNGNRRSSKGTPRVVEHACGI